MELKIFGKSVFDWKSSRADGLLAYASQQEKESKFLPDFHTMTSDGNNFDGFLELQSVSNALTTIGTPESVSAKKSSVKKEVKPVEKAKKTPKEVFLLQTLDDKAFELNTDPVYVEEQIDAFKDKLSLIKSEEYDMRRGVTEISSIVMRLENRKKYPEVREFFEEFAYTTTSKINALVKDEDNLKLGQVAQFLADMPKEAVKIMKDYNTNTTKLCGKQAVFYIIADKKDFKKSDQRRDPILLAQSPFGHVWQILGAWDKEMMFLEQL